MELGHRAGQQGFTIVEVLVALSIMSLGMIGKPEAVSTALVR